MNACDEVIASKIDQSRQYRGYIGSRAYACGEFPQHVQNMIIRNYCQKYGMTYLLSATEYAMPGCYMILEEIMQQLPAMAGVVMFSIFMLPRSQQARYRIYDVILSQGKTCHAALEDLAIRTQRDIAMVEDILRLNQLAVKNII